MGNHVQMYQYRGTHILDCDIAECRQFLMFDWQAVLVYHQFPIPFFGCPIILLSVFIYFIYSIIILIICFIHLSSFALMSKEGIAGGINNPWFFLVSWPKITRHITHGTCDSLKEKYNNDTLEQEKMNCWYHPPTHMTKIQHCRKWTIFDLDNCWILNWSNKPYKIQMGAIIIIYFWAIISPQSQ